MLDAHCHFWALGRGDYGWLSAGGEALAPIRRDFLPEDYPAKGRLIVIQAAPSLAETDFLLQLAQTTPEIAGVVGWVDLTLPETIDTLQRLALDPKFLGLRPMLQDIAASDWILTAPRSDVLAEVERLGLRFDALVTQRHLPALLRFAQSHHNLPVIIDHAAKPQKAGRGDWLLGLKPLGRLQNCSCKFSGLLTEFTPDTLKAPLPALREIFLRLLDIFGPERLIWGSDWPVVTLAASYSDWQALTIEVLAEVSAEERAAIMGGNAARIYGVAP